jgi:uncharacterized membrane protein HdeD (DUF308 family)
LFNIKFIIMNIVERAKAPTPKFFRVLRSIGLALLAISGSVITAPVVLPMAVVTVAGYVAVAGGVISAVSQMTVDDKSQRGIIENRARNGD